MVTSAPGPDDLLGTGRHLSSEELRTWTRFLDSARLIDNLLSDHLNEEHGMTHAEYEILVRLDGSGGSMRVGELADQIVAPRPRVTQTLHRVEAKGWIGRRPDPEDGRAQLIRLRKKGSKLLAAASGKHADLIREHLLGPIGEDRLTIVGDAMDDARTHLRGIRRMR